jgi:hypothetical protein
MKRISKFKIVKFLTIFSVILILVLGFTSIEKSKDTAKLQKPSLVTGAYYMKINNLELPLNNAGVIADVTIPPYTSEGKFDGIPFLFSAGFAISGYIDIGTENEFLWANAVATASRVRDYVPGPVGSDPNDPKNKLYVVRSDDPPFGDSWQEWKTAVELGADFYDGDGDGKYNPIDKNGNGEWDLDEDRPDLLGDETVWCVINDGVPAKDRRYTDVNPLGIEVHQTVFGFASSGLLGNILFIRYKVINKNPQGKILDSIYFSVWADPDLGEYTDDLVGCDVSAAASGYPKTPPEGRNAGYVYNNGPDRQYGPNPPTFLIDFFQGPFVHTGNSTDTAFNIRGPVLGVDTLVGYKQLGISSFLQYFQSTPPDQADPVNRIEMRYYTMGYNRRGQPLNPCTWAFGSVFGGVDCNRVDPRFFYSGDPYRNIGWIQTTAADERLMANTGMFRLRPFVDTAIIVAAYVVGRGTSATSSIEEAKRISDFAQFIYDQNFRAASPPPAPKVIVKTTENSIDLIWPTRDQVTFQQKTVAYDQRFEGYELWAFRTNSVADEVAGLTNAKILARWDLKNKIDDVLQEDAKTGERKVIYKKGIQLDSAIYADPQRGFIKYTITTDPWTDGPIVKGKPYYFAVISYALNHDALIPVDPTKPTSNYYISGAAFVGASANVKKIINGGIIPGQDLNNPKIENISVSTVTFTDASFSYDIIDENKVTNDEYEISFVKDPSSIKYFLRYNIDNKTKNIRLISNSDLYYNLMDAEARFTIPKIDGILPKINWVDPKIKEPIRKNLDWVKPFRKDYTGVFYCANDILGIDTIKSLPATPAQPYAFMKHNLWGFDKVAQIEIRFSNKPDFGKAYRFIRLQSPTTITSAFERTGIIDRPGEYFVDVPFQVWLKDPIKGIEKQLAAGFIEAVSAIGGTPDGVWNPGDSISKSSEYIIVFHQDYDPTGSQIEYIGFKQGSNITRADLKGWTPPSAANLPEEKIAIARARWLGAIYVVGIEMVPGKEIQDGGILTIPINYPLTESHKFTFRVIQKSNVITTEYKKSLFDRVTVFPNPLYAYNPTTGYYSSVNNPKNDEPFVTFSNLPEEVTIKIYTLSGQLIRVLSKKDQSPWLNWDLKNRDGLRVASGVYIAVVSSPGLGEKVLKFSIIQPQKQIQRY